jgi:leucyl-tRNA synthetase
MFDWNRTVEAMTRVLRWTQWLFIQMFRHDWHTGKSECQWCPSDKTVLADEQVVDGKCERCGNIVKKIVGTVVL